MSIQISLGEPLNTQAAEAARKAGISVEELVRRAIDEHLKDIAGPSADPFFADTAVYDGPDDGVRDLVENHDRHLYDADPHGGTS